MKQAKRGGETVSGVFYQGGQFLPSDNEPKRGKYNRNSQKVAKVSKKEVAPYVWEVAPRANACSIYQELAGRAATFQNGNRDKLVFCASDKTVAYFGWDVENVKLLIEAWNNGERWF